jgi:hypothetical protein
VAAGVGLYEPYGYELAAAGHRAHLERHHAIEASIPAVAVLVAGNGKVIAPVALHILAQRALGNGRSA